MSAVDTALAEIVTTLAAIAPAHEGLRDFASLNIQRDTQVEVKASLTQFDRRVQLLTAARVALESLIADGVLGPPREIGAEALKDLQQNAASIAAALALFATPAQATGLGLGAGETETK